MRFEGVKRTFFRDVAAVLRSFGARVDLVTSSSKMQKARVCMDKNGKNGLGQRLVSLNF